MSVNRPRKIIVIILAFLMVSIATPAPALAQDGVDPLRESERILTNLYSKISPSVVSIRVDQLINGQFQEWSGGSGFVIDSNGNIITNYHVIDNADRVVVSFIDGTITEAEIIGMDPHSDIAVIRVDLTSDKLVPLPMADSDSVIVGQTTLAIGSPFGQDWTLTTGVVSALNRQITSLSSFEIGSVIQTDTAINPGNSGGPLINLDGQVIGVNTQILSELRASSGVGFAVPSNLVDRVSNELIEFGEVNYGYIGIDGEDITLDYMQDLSLPNDLQGVVVLRVSPGEPAEIAGLIPPRTNNQRNGRSSFISADIITAINDYPIRGIADLLGYTATYTRPGDIVQLTVFRNGEYISLDLELGMR